MARQAREFQGRAGCSERSLVQVRRQMATLARVTRSFRPGGLEIYAARFGRRRSRVPLVPRRDGPAKLRAERAIPGGVLSERQDAEPAAASSHQAEICCFHCWN